MPDVLSTQNADDYPILLAAAQAGCPVAAQEFFNRYADAIRLVIRRGLKRNPKVRTVWDSDDFMQRTRAKLFQIDFDEKHFENPQALLSYLARIAENEVKQENRKLSRQAKAAGIEGQAVNVSADKMGEIVDKTSDHTAEIATEETWQALLASLPPLWREIAVLLREGYSQVEIAKKLKTSDRNVGRAVRDLADKLGYTRRKRT
jgi:RNA polymerase sigma factor (sigma-70 family)